MKKRISIGSAARTLAGGARRFPVSVMIIAALAVLFILEINDVCAADYRLWLFLPVGFMLATSATLIAEERLHRITVILIALGVTLLWGLYCVLLPADDAAIHTGKSIELIVIGAAAFLSVFFISFFRRGDGEWWNFASQTLVLCVLGSVMAAIFFGGFSLAFLAFGELFDIRIADNVYGDLSVVCFVVFAPLYVLSNIPSGAAKHDSQLHPTTFGKVLSLYIFTPILAAYALILYAYLFRIIFAWELPNGMVSWLVTLLAVGGLVVALELYPLRMKGDNKAAGFLSRWTGIIVLPLLVLMTVGIARRISDYGLTINRCYILLLNLWFYGVYAWLFFVRGRRVKWIVISPVVVALIASIGPWSVANTTKHIITRNIENYLDGTALSLDNAGLDRTDTEGLKQLYDNVDYLRDNFGEEYVAQISGIGPDSEKVFQALGIDGAATISEWFSSDNTIASNSANQLGRGYENFVIVNWYDGMYLSDDEPMLSVVYGESGAESVESGAEDGEFVINLPADNREFRLPLSEISSRSVVRGKDFIFLVQYCYGPSNNELTNINGYLFY